VKMELNDNMIAHINRIIIHNLGSGMLRSIFPVMEFVPRDTSVHECMSSIADKCSARQYIP
jgi:hypothetical protein